jgi:hypothetical protein
MPQGAGATNWSNYLNSRSGLVELFEQSQRLLTAQLS